MISIDSLANIKSTIIPHKNPKTLARSLSDIIKKENLSKDNPDKIGWELAKKIITTNDKITVDSVMKVLESDLIYKKVINEEDMNPNEQQQLIIDDKSLSKNQKIKDLTASGATVGMISKALNLTYQRVRNIAKTI